MKIDKLWLIVLGSYAVLLVSMGYVAFFHLEYNPASYITEATQNLLENDSTKDVVKQALVEEGKAFQMRRDLAIQSFNIILGAVLGFLSAMASFMQSRMKQVDGNKSEQQREKEIEPKSGED